LDRLLAIKDNKNIIFLFKVKKINIKHLET